MDLQLASVHPFVNLCHPVRQMHRVRCVTVSHRRADAAVRARLALSPDEQRAFYDRLDRSRQRLAADGLIDLAEAVVVSTCNRSEVYVTATASAGAAAGADVSDILAQEAIQIWADLRQLTSDDLEHVETLSGPAAVQHLLEVAAGLQSLVLGETQIVQQLKEAYQLAYECRAATSVLYAFFHAAFRVGRRARAETAIAQGNVSTASVGVELARQKVGGSLRDCTVLLVGAGKIGRLTVEQLLAAGVRDLRLANRTVANLAPLVATARRLGVEPRVAKLSEVSPHLAEADVMLTAVRCDEPLFTRDALQRPARRSLIAVDLGMPPNVAPDAGELPDVHRIGIDDLRACSGDSLGARQAEVPKVRRIIAQEWAQLEDTNGAVTRGVVDALFRAFQEHNLAEVARQAKYGMPQTEDELVGYGQRLARRLLKPVVDRLGKMPADTPEDLETLKRLVDLFGLHPDEVE